MSENVGVSTSRNPKGLHGLYRDNFSYLREQVFSKINVVKNTSINRLHDER
jgi:hypothetical protein